MSCNELGFDDYGNLRLSKSADVEQTGQLPSTFDLTGYTGEMVFRASEADATALLTLTTTETAAGSVLIYDGQTIGYRVKAADASASFPDADDADDPWMGVYEWVSTDTTGLTQRTVIGSTIVEKGVVR
jgi:hypothetical protein